MYHVSTQGIDERMINVHYYYYNLQVKSVYFNCPSQGYPANYYRLINFTLINSM